MRRGLERTITFYPFALLLLVAALFIAALSPGAASPEGSLTYTRGAVYVHRADGPGKAVSAGVGDRVGREESLLTGKGSYGEVSLPGNVLLRVGPASLVRFSADGKGIILENGSLLLQAPAGSGTATVVTDRISVETDGGTVMVSHAPARYSKFILLEGSGRASVTGRFGEWMTMEPGAMLILPPGVSSLPDPVDVDLKRLVATSGLVQMGKGAEVPARPKPLDLSRIGRAVSGQQDALSSGTLINTNLLMLSGTNLLIASDNLLSVLEDRANAFQHGGKEGLQALDRTSTIDTGGYVVRDGLPVAAGDTSANSSFATFYFDSLSLAGNFAVTSSFGGPNKLDLRAQEGVSVNGPFRVNSALTTTQLTSSNSSVILAGTVSASTSALSLADRAKITQASGEYYGVDKWFSSAPIPTGTKLVHGASSDAASTTVAYSNYFATEQAKIDSMVGASSDARLYNGFVQVGPYRNPSVTGDFTYRPYVITYTVMRPMPVAYALVANNPQMNTTGATGGYDQYYTPFRRQDLIRLGYIKPLESVACINTVTDIPRYVALSGRTTTQAELNTLAETDYYAYFNTYAPASLAEAESLRLDATAIRTNQARSTQEFLLNAPGQAGDITVGTAANIDGFSRVGLTAGRSISLASWVMGTDIFSATAGKDISVQDGALVEAFTDNRATGGGTISMTSGGATTVSGRIQAGSSPWIMGSSSEKAGTITLTSRNTDPDSPAINVTDSGQILALLAAASVSAGRAKVQLTSAGGGISIDGLKDGGVNYGKNVVADYGDLTISNTGLRGTIDILSGAGLQADIIKIGALGTQGVLNIYAGSRMDANTQIRLFGGELSGGAVVFAGTGTVNLISPSVLVSADKVQVNTGVNVNTGAISADVYANKRYWSPAQGGDAGSPQAGTWSTTPTNRGAPLGAGSF